MKKRISAFLLALALCMSFSSCGSSEEEKTVPVAQEEVTTAETTTTTAKTEKDTASETTAKKKKSKSTDSKSAAKKKKKKAAETTTAKETEAPEKAVEETSAAKVLDNGVYSLSFPEDKWTSLEDFRSLIKKMAKEGSDQYKNFDFDAFIGDMYFYSDDTKCSYPTNFVLTKPVYEASAVNFKISDFEEIMINSVKQQWQSESGISFASHDYVNHNGVDMLRIRANCDKGTKYICDEYVFLAKGNMCVIAVNYFDSTDGISAVNDLLDSIKIK